MPSTKEDENYIDAKNIVMQYMEKIDNAKNHHRDYNAMFLFACLNDEIKLDSPSSGGFKYNATHSAMGPKCDRGRKINHGPNV